MRKITEIPATIFKQSKEINRKYRAAAYCRVSTDKEEQENSLENQITYYKNKIDNTPNWTLVDIFADFVRKNNVGICAVGNDDFNIKSAV